MPSEQHEQWKRDLFNHLERKLNGCIGCGIGEDPKDHLPVHRGHQYFPSQQIIWRCQWRQDIGPLGGVTVYH